MCCFKKRTTPAAIVAILSILALAGGALLIAFSVKLKQSDLLMNI